MRRGPRPLEEQIGGRCVHFNGVLNKACEAGVPYDRFRESPKYGTSKEWLPCLRDGECVECDKRRWPTEAEVAAEVEEIRGTTERTMKAMAVIAADAKARNLGIDNGGSGVVPCPVCGGQISYLVAALNGHFAASCSGQDCVGFI